MKFSQRILELRTSLNVSQQAVANGCGFTLRLYQYYEAGTREPKISSAIKLADYFNVSLDYLVGRSDVKL